MLRAFSLLLLLACPVLAAPPQYDHVVVVIEENHSLTQIMGNRLSAPFINQLADGGVSFTNFYAITHPSQPNYLEFYGGSNQGITHNGYPRDNAGNFSFPFTSPNLGALLIERGFTFASYSESLPAAGDAFTEVTYAPTTGIGLYARKHNPVANWQSATALPYTVPPAANQPFTSFPTDFTQLPTVSLVVPNLQNDMHDGSVRQADDWLSANLGAYAQWAKTHNSLLIVTWDEDERQSGNRIPTIFYGAGLKPGVNTASWTLHNLLRTIEEMYGISTHAGSSASVEPISGVFASDYPIGTLRLRQGLDGYNGVVDTQLRADLPTSAFGAASPLTVDLDDNDAVELQPSQSLIRFDQFASRVPPGALILSAKLILTTHTSTGEYSSSRTELHRMLSDWNENSTWDGLTNGVLDDDFEASKTVGFSVRPNVDGSYVVFDVTKNIRDWLAGNGTNRGWALLPTGVDAWRFYSSEEANVALRPMLEITYAASVLEFSSPTYLTDESASGAATITVTRSGWANDAVLVGYTTADGSASAPADYTLSAGQLIWAAGDTGSRTFTVPIVADSLVEADETVGLSLNSPTGAATLTALSSATLTIRETPYNNWRVAKFGASANTASIAGDQVDPDGDGQNNLNEYRSGTEPLLASSVFTLSLAPSASQMLIQFAAQPGHTYTVQYKLSLADPSWQKLVDIAAAPTLRQLEVSDPLAGKAQRFYRVITP